MGGVMDCRRAFTRNEVRLDGKLILDGSHHYDCLIEDISQGGARVTTSRFVDLPNKVSLLEQRTGDMFECEVR